MPATDHSRHFDGLPMISGLPPEADVVTGRAACLEDTNSGSRPFWASRQIERSEGEAEHSILLIADSCPSDFRQIGYASSQNSSG